MQLHDKQQFLLALPSKEGVHFLFPAEIIRCEAEGNYTRFYIIGDKQHLTSRTLGEYEELLSPYHFIRSHKSHLVNRDFVSFIDHHGRSEEHTSELQSLMRISYAVFCLKKKTQSTTTNLHKKKT